jgi:hypothetical protein
MIGKSFLEDQPLTARGIMKSFSLPILPFALMLMLIASAFAQQQTPAGEMPPDQNAPPTQAAPSASVYTPKYKGDPAHSDSEFNALGYMRMVMRAEVAFHKQYGHYAIPLSQLVHTRNFTQRMVDPHRGDYTVGYKGKTDSFILTMTPNALDVLHRSFYADDDGKIHADETKAADADSQVIETHRW